MHRKHVGRICIHLQPSLECLTAGLGTAPSHAVQHTDAADGRADEDGDVVMAEEEADQLLSSLQAARHDSTEWGHPQEHPSISMLLYGQQVGHLHFTAMCLQSQ